MFADPVPPLIHKFDDGSEIHHFISQFVRKDIISGEQLSILQDLDLLSPYPPPPPQPDPDLHVFGPPGSGSGSISQRHGSADPDPHQNVMDPHHCFAAKANKHSVLKNI